MSSRERNAMTSISVSFVSFLASSWNVRNVREMAAMEARVKVGTREGAEKAAPPILSKERQRKANPPLTTRTPVIETSMVVVRPKTFQRQPSVSIFTQS